MIGHIVCFVHSLLAAASAEVPRRHCECLESAAVNSMIITSTSPFQLQLSHLDDSNAGVCTAKVLKRPAVGGSQQIEATCLRHHQKIGWAAISLVHQEPPKSSFSRVLLELYIWIRVDALHCHPDLCQASMVQTKGGLTIHACVCTGDATHGGHCQFSLGHCPVTVSLPSHICEYELQSLLSQMKHGLDC